ncbi:hypothetical protein C0J52_10982 [Blattella germanica]|nr:hypothetical protein C0J52_10982 [Blattella germanica]
MFALCVTFSRILTAKHCFFIYARCSSRLTSILDINNPYSSVLDYLNHLAASISTLHPNVNVVYKKISIAVRYSAEKNSCHDFVSDPRMWKFSPPVIPG